MQGIENLTYRYYLQIEIIQSPLNVMGHKQHRVHIRGVQEHNISHKSKENKMGPNSLQGDSLFDTAQSSQ